MIKTLIIAGSLALAATPAALTVMWPEPDEASILRKVELSGPIESFSQSQDRIQVRLIPASRDTERLTRRKLVVSAANGSTLAIPLTPGQTWVSSELPPTLADAGALEISVR